MVQKILKILANDYLSAVMLGVIACLVFKLFWLPAFAFVVFVVQLYVGSKRGFKRAEQILFLVAQIIFIAWVNPSSYLFTLLYVMAMVWFVLGKLLRGRVVQNVSYIAMLGLFVSSPSILFFLCVHYQRLLQTVIEVFA